MLSFSTVISPNDFECFEKVWICIFKFFTQNRISVTVTTPPDQISRNFQIRPDDFLIANLKISSKPLSHRF